MIRKMRVSDIDHCAEILCSVYNNAMYQCRWNLDTAKAYLYDYFEAKKFIDFTLKIDNKVCGAMLCHQPR